MEETFGKKMEKFALSVDIVDENTWNNAKAKIEEYLKKLKIDNFRLLVERTLDDGSAFLVSEWKMGEKDWGQPIKDKSGYTGQNAFAYDNKKCLWVVGTKKEPLCETSRYLNLWDNIDPKKIPKSRAEADIRTSIFIPLIVREKREGIVSFESREYLEFTHARKEEFKSIAEAIRILYHLNTTHKIRQKSTQIVLGDMKVEEAPKLPKPREQVFLAYSERASGDVVEAIKDLLSEEYENKLEVIDWRENPEPGSSISQKLVKNILECEYGICYFSEKLEESSQLQFRDNPNVLIEAGMFYILLAKKTGVNLKSWIPIREKEDIHADKLPFDLKDRNIIMVNREGDKLNRREFKEQLGRAIKSLLPED